MKKLFNKKAFALLLCLVLALTALLTVTAFADTAPADGTAAQTEEAADSGVSAKAIASGVAIVWLPLAAPSVWVWLSPSPPRDYRPSAGGRG